MRIPIKEVTPEIGQAHVAGWVHEERDLGGLTFLLVRDRTGILQVTIPKKKVSEMAVEMYMRSSCVFPNSEMRAL